MNVSVVKIVAPSSLELWIQNKQEPEVTKPMNTGGEGAGTVAPGAPGAPQGDQPSAPQGGMFQLFLPLLIMFAVLYFVILRPERKRQKDAVKMRSALAKGDRVLLSAGMSGTVAGISDDWVTVEIADKVRVNFQKSAILQVLESKEKADAPAAAR